MRNSFMIAALIVWVGVADCEKSNEQKNTEAQAPTSTAKPKDEPKAAPATGQPTDAGAHGGHGGAVIDLGTVHAVAFSVRATHDQGEIKPGGDAPIDVWIDGGVGKDVSVVRFWIGTQDAKGSIKAKADIENGKWHTHAEVPDPLPAGSKVWVEIETSDGKRAIGSFDLKM